MLQTAIRLGLVILSWTSLIFLPKESLKRYMPVSVFTSVLVLVMCALAIPYRFWTVEGKLPKRIMNDLSFVFGTFFAGTLWIFHFTYGNFKRYVVLNSVMNFLLAFPLGALFEKLKVYRLVNFKNYHVFLVYYLYSFIIYGYQMLLDRTYGRS